MPYISNVSPADTDPHFVSGSSDILTSINNYAERRPGFANPVETTPTQFNNLQRTFTWDRFDGSFYIMACDINSNGFAQVYKLAVGIDASFVSIFTDTSGTPFDFVVSNNTLYFSNSNTAQKWDPVNGLSNWGIATGSVNNAAGPTIAGNGSTVSRGGKPWTNPNNVTSSVAFATCAPSPGQLTDLLFASQFGFTIPSTSTIQGISVTFTAAYTGPGTVTLNTEMVKAGHGTGTYGSFTLSNTPTTFTFGGTSSLFGVSWVPNDINQTTFGCYFFAPAIGSSGTYKVDNVMITIYSLGGPVIAVSGAGGTLTATAGYTYVFCYGNSLTGHISSPSPPSLSTGVFTNKANVSVTVTASLDAQVNQIRVFRTTDGGGGTYFELPTSPYPNTSGAILDTAADTSLTIASVAPTPTFNDPPTPFQGMVYFSGRIWGFVGNRVWFSGLEEINQGVPEECFPSGIAGNFWTFDEPVQGLGLAGGINNQVLAIFCGGRIYGISGNTLDTFRRFTVSKRRGCRNRTCVTELGGMCAWLDSANQVWASDGNTLQELSQSIRPDIVSLNPSNCDMTFHVSGRFNWLILSTGTKLFVYDIDLEQWMPPWNFSCQYLFSGEISLGNYVLMAAKPNIALQMSTTAHNDNLVTYAPVIKTNLLSVVPDFGKRFSYIASGIYNEPTRTGVPWTFQVTNNGQALADVAICQDDDPTQAAYTSIAANLQDTATTYNRANGQFMKQLVYPTRSPMSRWIGMKIVLANADQVDNIYELIMAYKPGGGR